MEIYRKQLELAWKKEILDKAGIMLKELRSSLGISEKDHERMKSEIMANVQKD